MCVCVCVCWYRLEEDGGTGLRGGLETWLDQEHSKDIKFQIMSGLHSPPAIKGV